MNPNTSVTTSEKPQGLKALINSEAMREQLARALPKHLTADRFTRIAITALTRTPKLQECTPESFMRCLLDLSAMGLEPDGRRAHLIPYKNECTLVVDYKGIVELVMRSGMVSRIHADKVCDNDAFEYDCGDVKLHKIDFRKPRGEAYAYYALVKFKDGTEKSEVMSLSEIEAIRNRSQGYKSAIQYNKSHPWLTDFDEMAKKTVFRRCSKWLQLSPEIRDALEKDSEPEDFRVTTGRVVNESAKLANPYEVAGETAYADLKGAIPDPQPTGDAPMESPVEVSESTERLEIYGDIQETCREVSVSMATFEGRAKKAGLMDKEETLKTVRVDFLRVIHSNRMAIAMGQKIGGDA